MRIADTEVKRQEVIAGIAPHTPNAINPVVVEPEIIVLEPVVEIVQETVVEPVVLEPVVETVEETIVEPEITVVEPVVETVVEPEIEDELDSFITKPKSKKQKQ